MRYLAIQRDAIEEIIGNRLLQSVDFAPGQRLAEIIKETGTDITEVSPRLGIQVGESKQGRLFVKPGTASKSYIVFDLDSTQLFSKDKQDSEVILYLQRVLRFAIKYWDGKVTAPNEAVFPSHAKAFVFPHPISQRRALGSASI